MSELTAAFDRILELAVTADESDDSLAVSAAKFYRNRQSLNDSEGWTPGFTGGSASATACEIEFSRAIPTPGIVRLVPTFQA